MLTEVKSTIRKIIEKLETLLNSEDQKEPEQPRPLLTGPCIAKTRDGQIVAVQRCFWTGYPFVYKNVKYECFPACTEAGRFCSQKDDCDIVEVIRPLTDQEVLDWQFRGIEPNVSEASDRSGVVVEVFKSCELGRKEAEQMGLIHLGKATSDVTYEVNGTLYYFDFWYKEWKPKPGDYRVCEDDTYAYKPAT